MGHPLSVAPKPPTTLVSTKADVRLTVHVDSNSDITARRFGDRTELVVSDPQGRTVVTLELPASDFRRLVSALAKSHFGEPK